MSKSSQCKTTGDDGDDGKVVGVWGELCLKTSIQNNFKCDTGQKAHIWGWVGVAINLDAGLAVATPALYIFVNEYLRNNRTPTHRGTNGNHIPP